MKLSTKPPSGMRDFLPMAVFRRQYVVDVIRRVYERYGFVPLETPTIENLSTLLGKYGEEGDQLLYRILHRRDALDRALAENPSQETLADEGLRYDLTVPLARVVAQYNLPKFFRRYQIQPVWRADRPGKGRFREFYQCDIDITGTSGVFAEVEVCSAIAEALHALGFADFQIQVNHRQFLRKILQVAGIDLQHEARVLGVLDKLEKIGENQVREELLLQGVAASSIQLLMDQVLGNPECSELQPLLSLLDATPAGPHVVPCPSLVRGLGYYTGAIFEVVVPDLAGSLGGGGRYDDLIGMFGKKQVPAVGFSLGLERILVVMEERGMFPASLGQSQLLVLCWIDVLEPAVLRVSHHLRELGIKVETYPEKAKLGKQLEYADALGAAWVGILGPNELSRGVVAIKNLHTGEQTEQVL